MENHAFFNYWVGDFQIKVLKIPKFVLLNSNFDKETGVIIVFRQKPHKNK